MPVFRPPSAPVLLLLAMAVGCGGSAEEPTADAAPPAPVAETRDTAAPDQAAAAEPEEIYYDLTEFDWYREGRPLEHDARGYMPAGVPVALEASDLAPAGSHDGVTYYRRAGGGDTLFVPVFPRYWQPFGRAGR